MKEIKLKCFDSGMATISTGDIHLENENLSSKIIIDFTNTKYKDKLKWVDIVTGSRSYRYELGKEEVVSLNLRYENTYAGEMIITPFIYDGMRKIKYRPNDNIIIHKQDEAGGIIHGEHRDDYIVEIRKDTDNLLNNIERIITLNENETIAKNKLAKYDMIMVLFKSLSGVRKSVNFSLQDAGEVLNIKEKIKEQETGDFMLNSDSYNLTFNTTGNDVGVCELIGIRRVKENE